MIDNGGQGFPENREAFVFCFKIERKGVSIYEISVIIVDRFCEAVPDRQCFLETAVSGTLVKIMDIKK